MPREETLVDQISSSVRLRTKISVMKSHCCTAKRLMSLDRPDWSISIKSAPTDCPRAYVLSLSCPDR